uniref:DUF1279 domain-containing protein n=1 Tax=Fibrocapsa japonica TaxID=94617 RepID=A0A7S2V8E4_9STRA|mmetsp:Transcript_9532/g.14623  ORF Transcript_9532/g.14623 Transcript_9532/m.14623 type:complete len:186 (+) Transcript_9532:83-640(+)|eukprot:CAMPEP_0113937322 /NCGR_PEP_ID=MMETSP1339-20121228/3970_1 /TAXON_ID=94617 /ORGANISM="Fibrocapsa japonica" /LENGTH=185 /DNA_ID=CAMNT_0000940041 /DNA_START=80 /DNA_END=637 /DNA_ORIENTATION=+ /assembly_acc=CAM_ASM_000762
MTKTSLQACMLVLLTISLFCYSSCFVFQQSHRFQGQYSRTLKKNTLNVLKEKEELKTKDDKNLEEVTEKYGLEAGLFQAFKSGGENKGVQAKELLQRYGSAYLITSITFALISFGICYTLVDNGVDVAGLLEKVGIQAGDKAETAGTFAIAYAAHKAASPIRFPPTVALTPVVAKALGKKDIESS